MLNAMLPTLENKSDGKLQNTLGCLDQETAHALVDYETVYGNMKQRKAKMVMVVDKVLRL